MSVAREQAVEKSKSSKMALSIGFVAALCALFYHIAIIFIFNWLDVGEMVFYNIFSIVLFASLIVIISVRQTVVIPFMVAIAEVIAHQILAEHFTGTATKFHFIIFVTGLLPYFIFDYRFRLAIPLTAVCSLIFIILDSEFLRTLNVPYFRDFFPADSVLPLSKVTLLKTLNISFSILLIVSAVLLFSLLISKSERQLTSQNIMLENEIKRASIIQQAFFKHDVSDAAGWDIAFCAKPMAGVSGDFFDFYRRGETLDGFGIFDVSGHGISSGLVTMLVKNIIHHEFYSNADMDLWEILTKINDRIVEEKGEVENFLTGIIVRFMQDKAELVVAGHPAPLVYNAMSGRCDYMAKNVKSVGAIGIAGAPTFFDSQYMDFVRGDRLFFYSDGVTDALNEKGEDFGKSRLLRAFAESVDLGVQSQMNYIEGKISQFRGAADQNDDISMICICRA